LCEARKRLGLCVLNYVVTSNHIHLLVREGGDNVCLMGDPIFPIFPVTVAQPWRGTPVRGKLCRR
jgi:hypothetical protein